MEGLPARTEGDRERHLAVRELTEGLPRAVALENAVIEEEAPLAFSGDARRVYGNSSREMAHMGAEHCPSGLPLPVEDHPAAAVLWVAGTLQCCGTGCEALCAGDVGV